MEFDIELARPPELQHHLVTGLAYPPLCFGIKLHLYGPVAIANNRGLVGDFICLRAKRLPSLEEFDGTHEEVSKGLDPLYVDLGTSKRTVRRKDGVKVGIQPRLRWNRPSVSAKPLDKELSGLVPGLPSSSPTNGTADQTVYSGFLLRLLPSLTQVEMAIWRVHMTILHALFDQR
jgi:hypothetical protein